MNIQTNPYHSTRQTEVSDSNSVPTKGNLLGTDAKNLVSGQSFKGEILDIRNNQVTIGLDNGTLLHAKIEACVDVYIGQKLLFEVIANRDNMITIKPVMKGQQDNPALQRVLEAAGITITDKNVSIVQNLMEQGMPIDRQTLQAVMRQSLLNPDTDVKTLIQMNRFQIPITSENVEQFEQYKLAEHRILSSIQNLTEDFAGILREWSSQSDPAKCIDLQNRFVELFTNGISAGEIKSTDMESNFKTELSAMQPPSSGTNQIDTAMINTVPKKSNADNVLTPNGNEELPFIPSPQKTDTSTQAGTGILQEGISQILSNQELEALSKQLEALGVKKEFIRFLSDGEMNASQFLAQIKNEMETWKPGDSAAIKDLFAGKEYLKIVQTMLKEQWLLNPEEVADKNKIKSYYEAMERQTEGMKELLSEMGQQGSNAYKHTSTMHSNVEFINELNQNFTYFQMPLRFPEQEVHSDLFVFMNKKSKMEDRNSYRVMLHLDMEMLGQTDVYITLKGSAVEAEFTLDENTSLDIVQNNMQQLAAQLKEKGYQLNAYVNKREKELDFVEDFLGQDQVKRPMKRYAFDVRM